MMEAEIIHVWNERHHFYGSYLYDSSNLHLSLYIYVYKDNSHGVGDPRS